MNLKRIAGFGVAGAVLAALIAGASTPGRRPITPPPSVRPTAADIHGAELAAEITRLRERLRPTAEPRSSRNLFQYRSERRAPAAAAAAVAAAPAPTEVVNAAPPAPMASLVGIAEDAGPDGPVRTAIVAIDGDVFLAKAGEPVTSRYRVAAVSSNDAELTDTVTGTTVRLRLP
jgi:hypothetical protein